MSLAAYLDVESILYEKEKTIMPKSKIIKNIADGKIDIEQALNDLYLLASDIDDTELMGWTQKELCGYDTKDEIPNYRKDVSYSIRYSGIAGNLKITNASLPPGYLSKETLEEIGTIITRESISAIQKQVDDGQSLSRDLGFLAPEIFRKTGTVQCTSITQNVSSTFMSDILASVKQEVIRHLIDLEKKYGSLDSLEIQTDNDPENIAFWNNINQRIKDQSKELYAQAFYASAAERAVREVETKLRQMFRELKPGTTEPSKIGDVIGALLTENGAYKYCDLNTQDGKDYCRGFVSIVNGMFAAYRNPMAHKNNDLTKQEAFELITLSSMIMEVLEKNDE